VKLFFDEDNGTGIPKALHLNKRAGDEIHYPSNRGHQAIKKGTPDKGWLPEVGLQGWLVFSQNKWMINNEEERKLIISNKVGIIYLDNGNEKAFPVMRMLLNRWPWLELVDATIPRPFAYLIGIGGRARKLDVLSDTPLGSARMSGSALGRPRPGEPAASVPAIGDSAPGPRLPGL
jgi:hypothetical protein